MLKPRLIPSLLLKGTGLVKTCQFKNPRYLGDPINAVRIFNDKCADELVFLDISATKESKEPNYDLINRIATECFMPFAYGGGVSSLAIAKRMVALGAEKLVLNTHGIENPDLIRELSEYFGSQSVVVSIDYKKGFFGKNKVYTRSGTHSIKKNLIDLACEMERMGAGEIILNCIDRDSAMKGYDLETIHSVSSALSIPLIASGGAGVWDTDFKAGIKAGAAALSAGSAFIFQGVHRAFLIQYPSENEITTLLS